MRPKSIVWLQQLSVPFYEEHSELQHTRDGGHSACRIMHLIDAASAAVQCTLIEQIHRTPGIELYENHALVDLIAARKLGEKEDYCLGLYPACHALREAGLLY